MVTEEYPPKEVVVMADSTSATDSYAQRDKVLRSLNKLETLVLSKDSAGLHLESVHTELERMIHTTLNFDDFELHDRLVNRQTVLGARLTKAIVATETIVTFRQLMSYRAGDIREIRGVGDGDILRIEAALASKGLELKVIVDFQEYATMYRRLIPANMPGGDKRYAYVHRGLHEPIAFASIWKWAGIRWLMPSLLETRGRVQTLGQLLKLSHDQLVGEILQFVPNMPPREAQSVAANAVDQLHRFVLGAGIKWEYFNDDLRFSTEFAALSSTIINTLRRHELQRVSDLRRFLERGMIRAEMDPGLSNTNWRILAQELKKIGAEDLAEKVLNVQ
jgi:hypothetical protein